MTYYFGGKTRMAGWIVTNMPAHRVYVEPFGGGGAVLLAKRRAQHEVYNDLDGNAVNFFRVLRDRGEELVQQLVLTPYARDEFDGCMDVNAGDEVERARRWYVRLNQGIGSRIEIVTGWRTSLNREVSHAVSFMQRVNGLAEAVERLRGVTIENKDFAEVIEKTDSENTFFYCDPPYVFSERADPAHGYRFEMTDKDHERLAEVLHGVRGKVMLSGYEGELYQRLYGGWRQVRREEQTQGRKAVECLWMNYAGQGSLF